MLVLVRRVRRVRHHRRERDRRHGHQRATHEDGHGEYLGQTRSGEGEQAAQAERGGQSVGQGYRAARVWEAEDLADMMARLATCPLAYHPGESWRYSLGMDVEGAIIERLTGGSLASFMRERIFVPLGMLDTAFYTPPAEADRLATLYLKAGEAPLAEIPNPMRPDHETEPALAWAGAGWCPRPETTPASRRCSWMAAPRPASAS